MKLMDVGIAVPFVEYHISVGCRIRRRAMIMEWVIIQMIAAALQHKEYKVYGVQFHPESIMTPEGRTILKNFLSL